MVSTVQNGVFLTPDQSAAVRAFKANGGIRLKNAENMLKAVNDAPYFEQNRETIEKLVNGMKEMNTAIQAYVDAGVPFKEACQSDSAVERLFGLGKAPAAEVAEKINAILNNPEVVTALQNAGILPKPEPVVEVPVVEVPVVEVKPTRFARFKQAVKDRIMPSTRNFVVGGGALAATAGLATGAYALRSKMPSLAQIQQAGATTKKIASLVGETARVIAGNKMFQVGFAGTLLGVATIIGGVFAARRAAPKVAAVARTTASKIGQAARFVGSTAKAAVNGVRSKFVFVRI